MGESRSPVDIDLHSLAVAYRRLVLWFGAQLVLQGIQIAMHFSGVRSLSVLDEVLGLGVLVTIPALAYFGFRTAQAMGSRVAWLWAIAMFVPCVNALTLLALSSRATQECASRGIRVGLLGPSV